MDWKSCGKLTVWFRKKLTLCNPSKLAVIMSSFIFCRYFCLVLLATSLLSAEVPVIWGFSLNGVPRTETTDDQQQVSTLLDNLIPASSSGLVSGVPWTFWSFCQSVRSWEGDSPPTSNDFESYSININCSRFTHLSINLLKQAAVDSWDRIQLIKAKISPARSGKARTTTSPIRRLKRHFHGSLLRIALLWWVLQSTSKIYYINL